MTVIWSVEECPRHCPKSFRDEGGYQLVNIVNKYLRLQSDDVEPLSDHDQVSSNSTYFAIWYLTSI